ncbi:type II secretion system protein [bacterium]|nr:type II secretion system protein [bacterium]
MRTMKSTGTRAFTLVEMLTVVAIIGVLAGIILPAMRKAKEKAKRTQCLNNLMQFSRAIDLFRVEHEDDFPDWLSNLYPSYIDSKEAYLCPADYCLQGDASHIGADGGKPWWEPDDREFKQTDDTKFNSNFDKRAHPRNSEISDSNNDPVDYCSYLYTFCGAPCPLSGHRGYTWKEAMMREMAKGESRGPAGRGGRVPIVSCFWHQKRRTGHDSYVTGQKDVLNVAVGHKNIYYTGASAEKWWK